MKATPSVLRIAAALAAVALSAGANAIPIEATSVTWSNAVGGSGVAYNLSNGSFTDVRWGESLGDGQSGLGFDPANPPAIDYPANTPFLLGSLRHYNNPIGGGTASSSVDLALNTTVTGGTPTNQSFAFRFLIDETPNVAPCAYASVTPCADRITFQNLDRSPRFCSAAGATRSSCSASEPISRARSCPTSTAKRAARITSACTAVSLQCRSRARWCCSRSASWLPVLLRAAARSAEAKLGVAVEFERLAAPFEGPFRFCGARGVTSRGRSSAQAARPCR